MKGTCEFTLRRILPVLFLISTLSLFSQKTDTDDIMATINNVFEAMRTNDSTLLMSCFTDNPNTFTVYENSEGSTVLSRGDFKRFVDAVGRPKEQVWNEPIWNEKIRIDDGLASVWVDYAFFIDDKFSHCGVDAFHLVKTGASWKIFHLVDTRRKNDCEIPEEVKP